MSCIMSAAFWVIRWWSAIMRPSMTTAFRCRRKGPRLEPPDELRDEPKSQGGPGTQTEKPSATAQPSPTRFGKGPNRTEPTRATQPNLKKQRQSARKHSLRLGWPEDETGAADPLTCSRRTNRYCEADPTPSVLPVPGAHTWWRELTVI